MWKLLSLPPNLVGTFHQLEGVERSEWYCESDPVGAKLGSGGGTAWLLRRWMEDCGPQGAGTKKIVLHAGGQSRRLPAYAPSGKILTPIPVFRWARGQKIGQNLLSLQLPLYEKIMEKAPASLTTLIASGDVYIRAEGPLGPVPEADVVCYGLWVDPELATHHGVYALARDHSDELDFMIQKPTLAELENLSASHLFLMDIGIWMLSDRALDLLVKRSTNTDGTIRCYDLYSEFGLALGRHPRIADSELNGLTVAILPLPGGEFYHYGTTRELLSSTVAVQGLVRDQRRIMHRKVKPHPAIFVQNSEVGLTFSAANSDIWIENSCVPASWSLTQRNVVTGVPRNDWALSLDSGQCLDIVPLGADKWVVRPYKFDDTFQGELQTAPMFPVVGSVEEMGRVAARMLDGSFSSDGYPGELVSAEQISASANLMRLYDQRHDYLRTNLAALAGNHDHSVFYQLDLNDIADRFTSCSLAAPAPIDAGVPLLRRIHNRMLRAQIGRISGTADWRQDEAEAFGLLRDGLLAPVLDSRSCPKLNVYPDQIVWGRSPVRIDVAGGWTDTPPFSLYAGGNVVNMAIELNGQPPLQVYVKPTKVRHIVLRSIDLGAEERILTFEQLDDYNHVGSPFSIPKAALALAGFLPEFAAEKHPTLERALQAFGCGIELTLLAAIPAGSGLGTSSILASTVLGALNDFCGLGWDKNQIGYRTLALEQLLTTGGGWQDQFGGVLHGVKLLQTEPGFRQSPTVRWLPEHLFTATEFRDCHLLYYTGITRTAKGILAEIVRAMFLNSGTHLALLDDMKAHALEMVNAIQKDDFEEYGRLVGRTWCQNQALDRGTNPPAVQSIINDVADLTLGLKLPGAGGGGYLYMVARDPSAAAKIRERLSRNPPNACARFVDMRLSTVGLQISRS